jgi:hypothetical protein
MQFVGIDPRHIESIERLVDTLVEKVGARFRIILLKVRLVDDVHEVVACSLRTGATRKPRQRRDRMLGEDCQAEDDARGSLVVVVLHSIHYGSATTARLYRNRGGAGSRSPSRITLWWAILGSNQ